MPFIMKHPSGVFVGAAKKDWFLDDNRQLTDDPTKAAIVLIRKDQRISKEMNDEYHLVSESEIQLSRDAEPELSATAEQRQHTREIWRDQRQRIRERLREWEKNG